MLLMSHLENFTESTLANDFYNLEVLKFGALSILILENKLGSLRSLWLLCTIIDFSGFSSHGSCDLLVIWVFFLMIFRHILICFILLVSQVFFVLVIIQFLCSRLLDLFLFMHFVDHVILIISKLLWWHPVNSPFLVFFCGCKATEICFLNVVNGQILLGHLIIPGLEDFDNNVTLFTAESVVVFIWNMNGEFRLLLF